MLTIFSISLAWCLNIYCDFLWSPTFNFLNGRALLYIDSDMMQIDTVVFFFFFESWIDTVSVLKEEQVQNVKMMIITFIFLSFKLYINGSKNFCLRDED